MEPFVKQIAKLARQIAKAAQYDRDVCDLLERDVTADLRFQLTMEYLHTDILEPTKNTRKRR